MTIGSNAERLVLGLLCIFVPVVPTFLPSRTNSYPFPFVA